MGPHRGHAAADGEKRAVRQRTPPRGRPLAGAWAGDDAMARGTRTGSAPALRARPPSALSRAPGDPAGRPRSPARPTGGPLRSPATRPAGRARSPARPT